ncbi:hypothetical protein SLS60_010547, partial [Paraconiothyrium brasiliense]
MDAFGTRAAPTRSSFPSSSLHAATSTFKSLLRRRKSNGSRRWKPPALHPFTFAIAIATPIASIVTLILLLRRSQRDNGIIFAPDINALPLSRTFMYQYFPTILAVIFSIFWAWIDLETKRLEPYYRLSEEKGALGKDSLLLSYPFGFVPMVPVKAFRQRHWPVFWASFALLLVTWGLVPTQAGIFSTEQVTRNVSGTFHVSTSSMPLEQQADSMSLKYMQSAYGIVSLNETLPQFMTRNYTLAPFRPTALDKQDAESLKTRYWTVPTTLYSLDLYCEPAIPFNNQGIMGWNNSDCAVIGLQMGNHTIGDKLVTGVDPLYQAFSAQYVGFWNKWGFADFYLSQTCSAAKNHTFFAAVSRNKEKGTDLAQNVTAIFCEPTYYAQEVNATVERANKHPVRVVPLGPKQPLTETKNIFNTTLMEMLLNGGIPPNPPRENELPSRKVPNFIEHVMEKGLTWPSDRQPMVGFSTMIDDTPLEDFLDWKVLAQTYAKAYRLVFARAMVEVLDPSFTSLKEVAGSRSIATGSVVLEPLFTYIVIGFLCVIVVATIVLLFLSTTRTLNLRSDPSTIGTVMGLVTDSKTLLRDFEDLDCCTLEQIQQSVQQKRYQLVSQDDQIKFVSINGSIGPIAIRSSGTDGSPSGAYRGGDGRDQFYVLESNISEGTTLPPWTDESTFYLPFKGDDVGNAASQDQFESETVTLSGRLNCEVIDLGDIGFNDPSYDKGILNKTVRMDGSQANCSSNQHAIVVMGPGNNDQVCQNGTSALELVLTLEATGANATQEEKEVCMGTVVLGWIRNLEGSCKSPDLTTETAKDSLFIQCQPTLVR